jgi:hypothetical protein
VDPGNDAAQDLALSASAAAVAGTPVSVEADAGAGEPPDPLSLRSRLLARKVHVVHVAEGAEPHELLALARALSHDSTPVPSTPAVNVELVPTADPPPSPAPAPYW